ncbi:MAG TPA: hypothetical protein VK859_15690 [bacterium]|jgi:hypothetical protein|nr:hypothetical protein [bacterium]
MKKKAIILAVLLLAGGAGVQESAAQTPTPTVVYCCQTSWSYPANNGIFSEDSNGLAYDPTGPGTLYVGGVSFIQSVNPATGVTIGTLQGTYSTISEMTRGRDGYLYVGDYGNQVVDKVAVPSGSTAAVFSFVPYGERVSAVCTDDRSPNEDVYTGMVSNNVYKVSQGAGTTITLLVFSPEAPTPARTDVSGLLIQGGISGAPSTLYVSDEHNNRIVKYIEAAAGSATFGYVSTVSVLSLVYPHQITQDASGKAFVCGSGGYNVVDSNFQTLLDNCNSSSVVPDAQGMAIDGLGGVYLGSGSDNGALIRLGCPFPTPTPPYSGSNPPGPGECFIYPSPARGSQATVSFDMAGPGNVEIKIWNQNAGLVAQASGPEPAGVQVMPLNISGLLSGVYFYDVVIHYDSGQSVNIAPHKFAILH